MRNKIKISHIGLSISVKDFLIENGIDYKIDKMWLCPRGFPCDSENSTLCISFKENYTHDSKERNNLEKFKRRLFENNNDFRIEGVRETALYIRSDLIIPKIYPFISNFKPWYTWEEYENQKVGNEVFDECGGSAWGVELFV